MKHTTIDVEKCFKFVSWRVSKPENPLWTHIEEEVKDR